MVLRIDAGLKQLLSVLPDDTEIILVFLVEMWPRIVGEDLARHSQPLHLAGRILRIGVPSAVWKSQLDQLAPDLVAAINGFWGRNLVERISIVKHLKT